MAGVEECSTLGGWCLQSRGETTEREESKPKTCTALSLPRVGTRATPLYAQPPLACVALQPGARSLGIDLTYNKTLLSERNR